MQTEKTGAKMNSQIIIQQQQHVTVVSPASGLADFVCN